MSPQFFPSHGSRASPTRSGTPLTILDLNKGCYVIDADGNVTGVAGAAQPVPSPIVGLDQTAPCAHR